MQAPKNKKTKTLISRHSSAAAIASNDDSEHSLFHLEKMPAINRRILHPFSVHYSLASSCWIATIYRHAEGSNGELLTKTTCFEFNTESESKRFCKSYSPPKIQPLHNCFLCKSTAKLRPFNCRNCGVCICDRASCNARWGSRMIPKTYVHSAYQPQTVRVCKSCDWLSNAFCMALLQGRYEDALKIFESGNVNLRTCFADIRGESMFPVHCCALGGNVQLLRWLVEKQLCPISVKKDPKGKMLSVKTSSDRTLIDLAMVGKPKLDVLLFLIHKGLSITDLADSSLTGRTLEAVLKSGFLLDGPQSSVMKKVLAVVDPSEGSCATIDNACNLCCEKAMDCVLSPCGHQLCCSDCGKQLASCPMCKAKCNVVKIIPC